MKRIAFAFATALFLGAITIALIKVGSDVLANRAAKSSSSSAQNTRCNVTIKVGKPTLTGALPRPTHVNVSWIVENLPSCYRISNSRVTFNIVARDGTNDTIGPLTINGDGATASARIALPSARLDRLFPPDKPAVITATVQTTAVPIAPSYTHTDVETVEVTAKKKEK
jgi:hypothetical protein